MTITTSSSRPTSGRARSSACLWASPSSSPALGLFGLAAFSTERRTKEIGLRKTFGARTRDIVLMLLWQFSIPVLIANLIAWPVA